MSKRDKLLSVRLGAEDLEQLRSAGERLWPGAPISNSTLMLTLAKMKAQEILKTPRQPRGKH